MAKAELTQEQIEMRKKGIGASDIAAIMKLNPWSSPYKVWLDKKGLTQFEGNAATDRGQRMEAVLCDWYSDTTGHEVEKCGTIVWPENPIIMATPDRLLFDDGVLEAKAPGRTGHHWGEAGTDQVPDYYLPQVQWQLGVTGRKWAHVVADVWGEFRLYGPINFNSELFSFMVEKGLRFWNDYVVADKEPPADGSKECGEELSRRYKVNNDVLVTPSEAVEKTIIEYRDKKQEMAKIKAELAAYENAIKQAIGENDGFAGPWGKFTWKATNKTDYEGLVDRLYQTDQIDEALLSKHMKVDHKTLLKEVKVDNEIMKQFVTEKAGSRRIYTNFK